MDSQGFKTFSELSKRSIEDIEWFWGTVNKDLGIEWYEPYRQVVDLSGGVQWSKWFIGGKINIAHNCLDRHESELGEKIAIISETETPGRNRKVSYKQLLESSNQIANVLSQEMGVRKGDRVGLYMPLIPETVASFFAILKVGATIVPIFSGYGTQAISSRLDDCDAKALITAESFERKGKRIRMLETALDAVKDSPSVKSVLVYGKASSGILDWSIVESSSKEYDTQKLDSEDTCLVIYTSGTTGKPKGAVHVHGGLQVKVAEEMAYQMDFHRKDIFFWFTDIGWIMAPWEFIGGLTFGGTLLIYDGAPDYPESDRLWQVISQNKVSVLGVSPTLVRSQMRYGIVPSDKYDLTSVHTFGSTGEPWNPESFNWLFDKVGKRKSPIINLSGGTEIGACFLSVHPILPTKTCSLGGPGLGMDLDVVDENGNPIRGETGELVARQPWPSITRGLWKDDERYIETYWSRFKDVWVHGDWASIDQDGYWFLHGRSDDTIKIAGKRIGPAEIEGVLTSFPAVLESIAIGVPDPVKGESLVCFVVLRPGYTASEKLASEIKNHISRNLGPTMAPSSIKFVESLPKTRNAKLVRRLVRSRYLDLPLGDTSNLENPEALDMIANAK